MAIPWRARQNLDAYLDWMGEVIEQSGGHLDPDCRGVDYLVFQDLEDDDLLIGAVVPEHCLRFPHDRTHLHFHQLVTLDIEVFEYAYQFMREDGSLVFRLCKNAHHAGEVGAPTHAHLPPGDASQDIEAAPEFDVEEVVNFIRDLAERGVNLEGLLKGGT